MRKNLRTQNESPSYELRIITFITIDNQIERKTFTASAVLNFINHYHLYEKSWNIFNRISLEMCEGGKYVRI